MTAVTDPKDASDRELVISRVFEAPPALIFKIWTQPRALDCRIGCIKWKI